MSNLINEVARLKDLEGEATPAPWEYEESNNDNQGGIHHDNGISKEFVLRYMHDNWGLREKDMLMLVALRNTAPKLLDILGTIRPGDVDALDQFRLWLNDLRLTTMDTGESDYETVTNLIDVLHRYRGIAAQMEITNEC